jgi:hypothetical protein
LTEPVITINGRTLISAQVKAVRGALLLADGAIDAIYDADRLTEVIAMLSAPTTERAQQERVLSAINKPRRDRILQLAGIAPETASARALALAEGYAAQTGLAVDEASTRLRRALDAQSGN